MASIYHQPNYDKQRSVVGAPVTADTTDLDALMNTPTVAAGEVPVGARGSANAYGWNSVEGYVELAGGITPTVTIQPLLAINANGTWVFVELGSTIGPLSDGDHFTISGVNQGLVFARIAAVTGSPTNVDVSLAGGVRANEGSI